MAKMAVLKMPKADRKKDAAQYLGLRLKTNGNDGQDAAEAVEVNPEKSGPKRSKRSEVAQSVNEAVRAAKAELKQGCSSTAKKSSRKKMGKTPSSVLMPPPSTGLRRSTRKRVPTNLELTTPMSRSRASSMMITPKFDTTTPMSRSVMRLAKPNETLVSLSGSPVCAVSTVKKTSRKTKKKQNEPEEDGCTMVPLGKGKMVMVPMTTPGGNSSQLDLDEEDKQKLLALRSQLDSMLNPA